MDMISRAFGKTELSHHHIEQERVEVS